ncbi:hypothetical protein Tco_0025038 [Tanacetum coccineum]
MHDDFIATVYPQVLESLKHKTKEYAHLENPLSSSGTLSSMKNLDEAFGDQFFNDKPTEEPRKENVETKVESMVTVPIHQASLTAPPLSTSIIDLSAPKPISTSTPEPIFTATTTTTTTLLLPPPPQQQSIIESSLASRISTLEQRCTNLEKKHKLQDKMNQALSSRISTLDLRDLPHKINQTVNEVVKEAMHMFESGTYQSQPEHVALYEALEASMDRDNRDEFLEATAKSQAPSSSSKQKSIPHSEQPIEKVPIPDDVNILDSEETDIAHLPKIKTRPDWLKPIPEEDRPKTPEPDWIGKSKLSKAGLEGPSYKGNRLVPDVGKPLPLGGPPGQVTIQPQFFFNKDLEYLVSGSQKRRNALSISKLKASYYTDFRLEELVPSLWIESEQEYDISAAYGITHWWFKRKEFYITRHSAPSDHEVVRSHMRILNVISLKTYDRYGYTFFKKIVLRRADYNEYKISKADFKILRRSIRNIVIRKHVEDLQLRIESYRTKLNLTQPDWDAYDFLFKEDYTIVSKPRAVIYKDKNVQKKMMRETEVHKYNRSMESRIWSEDDRRRSKDFMEVIERRLKIRRIFRSLESFMSGRSDTYTGNPVKEILLKLNIPDHRPFLTDSEVKMETEIPRSSGVNFITTCSYSFDKSKDIMKA